MYKIRCWGNLKLSINCKKDNGEIVSVDFSLVSNGISNAYLPAITRCSNDLITGNETVIRAVEIENKPKLIFRGNTLFSTYSFFNSTDPSVAKIDDQWTMFFTGQDSNNKLHIFSATKPVGKPLNEKDWYINSTPIVSPSESGWDATAVETCCFIEAAGEQRLYYTGWRTNTLNVDNKYNYSIGLARRINGVWVKEEDPVFEAANAWEISPYGSILGDQALIYHNNYWVMYYQVGTNVNTTATALALSADGITWEAGNRIIVDFTSPNATVSLPNGPYHLDAKKFNDKICLIGWLPNTDPDQQGIWFVSSNSILKEGSSSNFSDWKLLLSEQSELSWLTSTFADRLASHDNGLFGSCLVEDNGKYWLFFNSVVRTTGNIGNIGCYKLENFSI